MPLTRQPCVYIQWAWVNARSRRSGMIVRKSGMIVRKSGMIQSRFLPLVLASTVAAWGADSRPVTFSKDVAPILQRACQNCHRPGSIAPMSLLTYNEARPWARSIQAKVVLRQMPPWHIDRNVGITKFKDDPSLTDAEIETISNWVDQAAPEGRPSDMPPPRQFSNLDKWHI